MPFHVNAKSSLRTYAEWDQFGVRIVDSEELPEGATAAMQEVTQILGESTNTSRFKLGDKKAALDSIAKILGFDGKRLVDDRMGMECGNFVAPSVAVAWVVVKWVDSGPEFVAVA